METLSNGVGELRLDDAGVTRARERDHKRPGLAATAVDRNLARHTRFTLVDRE